MTDLQINFEYPWLLLLLIPAIFLTLFPYFRVAKKYRRTRNRIASVALHMTIMVLCILTLSGISFTYNIPNTENEVMLVVDASFSSEEAQEYKDEFIKSVLDEADSGIKVGVVTFGYDQVYAAELTTDARKAYDDYLNADLPDDSATDIAAALTFARDKIHYPDSAKIILISDGIETDGEAMNVVKTIAAEGIKVDTVSCFTKSDDDEVQIVGVQLPDYNLNTGVEFEMVLTTQSTYNGDAVLTVYDTSEDAEIKKQIPIKLAKGLQPINITHTFEIAGMHELRFEIESGDDTVEQNNAYYSYINLEKFDQILILENNPDEAKNVQKMLESARSKLYVKVVNVNKNVDEIPASLDELRAYDQVILVNIANNDMPSGFIELLHTYVYEIGGGLFTVGGNKVDANGNTVLDKDNNPVANAYDREDMAGVPGDPTSTLYKQMLPVQAVDYTPPLGLMFVIDRSGSMSGGDSSGLTLLDMAIQGANACLGVLTERDYCGVMTLEDDYKTEIPMRPATQKSQIEEAIKSISGGGGTTFSNALAAARLSLIANTRVEKRHIILFTDGYPGDPPEVYEAVIQENYELYGITLSIVMVGGGSGSAQESMQHAADLGHGYLYVISRSDITELDRKMLEDLSVPEITTVKHETFVPTIKWHTSIVSDIKQEQMPQLDGFYGTKLKEGATDVLTGPYGIPIYAQWKYGEGMVGSFMCDLNGYWSAEFVDSAVGTQLINNIVSGLFPTQSIRPKEIEAVLTEKNYTTQLSIYTDLEPGQTIEVTITSPPTYDNPEYTVQTVKPSAEDGYTRVSFVVTQPGIHEVLIEKKDENGNRIARYQTYKAFSYSAEYNVFVDEEAALLFLEEIAVKGKGMVITDPKTVFDDLIKVFQRIYDPDLLFIIISIVLFLLDVAVRKFKFKWPHEIIRDYKAKKEMK